MMTSEIDKGSAVVDATLPLSEVFLSISQHCTIMTASRSLVGLAIGLTVLTACGDRITVDPFPVTAGPPTFTWSSTGCGVQFVTIAAEAMPGTEYDPPTTRVDTTSTCLTWNGGDYVVHAGVVGTSAREVLSDPMASVSYQAGSVRAVIEGDTLVDPEPVTALFDLVDSPPEIRSAALNDPYFMFRSCPAIDEPPYVGDPEIPILPIADPGEYHDDPCAGGGPALNRLPADAGLRMNMTRGASRRDRVLESLTRGMTRSQGLEDGVWVYRGRSERGAQRTLRVHPVAKVVLSEESVAPGLREFQEHRWKRAGREGFVRTGMHVRAEVMEFGRSQVYVSDIRFSAIRFGRDAR
jgi:hypothetical protein